MVERTAPARRRELGWGLALAAAVAALAVLYTWPAARHFTDGIPYGYHVVPGYERMPLMPGDQLQFLYWCWLMVDNLFGPSALFSNPYEFNTFLSQGIPGFANFPFSLLYVGLYPLGQAPAYNALVLLSYLLAGTAAYLLAREVLGSALAAWPVGLVYALLPFRAAQVLSGHLYGFVAFLLPLMLWCLERGLKRRSLAWGAGAGACLAAMSLMEGHLVYYSALLVGLYLPPRLVLEGVRADEQGRWEGGAWPPVLAPILAGLGLGVAAQLNLVRDGAAFWSGGLAVGLAVWLAAALTGWLLLAWLATATSTLAPDAARRLSACASAPLALAPLLYAVQFWLDLPHLGAVFILALAAWGTARLLPGWWRARRVPRIPRGVWPPVAALAAGLAAAAGYMMHVKSRSFDGSIAGGGRSLHEVSLFAPGFGDLFDAANVHMEGLVFLGWTVTLLAMAGLALLATGLPSKARGAALAALWTFVGVLAALLCLGPNLPQLPLYGLLYKHLPFFNFPRVPGRLVLVAALMLSLAAAWALRELAEALKAARWAPAAAMALLALLALDYLPPTATGVCLLPPPGPVEEAVRRELPGGPAAKGRLLGLPIWPGDSHQSSIYELMISRTRAPMVNGYSPVVPRAYVEQVFGPLYPLDFGLAAPGALEALRRLDVRLITFHDDDLVYSRKVSPFPPALARERLAASGLVEPVAQEGNVFLYRPLAQARPVDAAGVVSPVTSLWEAAMLKRNTGRLVEDRQASGWGLLFEEPASPERPLGPRRPGAPGNVARAAAGRDRPGFLSFGPYKAFPPGDYLARFRLRRGPGSAPPGYVDVAVDQGRASLVRAELGPAVLPADGRWHDVALPFRLDGLTVIELRTYFSGTADLELDLALVGFAGQERPAAFYPASRLWRQTGDLAAADEIPGGLAVTALAGFHPPLYLMHGPQATLEPGRYRAAFRLAALEEAPAGAPAAQLVAAGDLGRRPLAHRRVAAGELGQGYRDFALEFTVPRRLELGLRVRYLGGVSLKLAGASLERLD